MEKEEQKVLTLKERIEKLEYQLDVLKSIIAELVYVVSSLKDYTDITIYDSSMFEGIEEINENIGRSGDETTDVYKVFHEDE